MAVGKNKRMSKGKKGGKKKAYVMRDDATRCDAMRCDDGRGCGSRVEGSRGVGPGEAPRLANG